MIRSAMMAIIKKDLRESMSDKTTKFALFILPLMMVLIMPGIMTAMAIYAPQELNEFAPIFKMLPIQFQLDDLVKTGYFYIMNYMMPGFFLLVPIMTASIAAGSSFAGEKERKTLETLIYAPLTMHQLFAAKVLGALTLALMVTAVAFLGFVGVAIVGSVMVYRKFVLDIGIWIVMLLLIVPALSLIGITVMVLASARARTFQEAQQYGAILVVPVMIIFMLPQIAGLFLYSVWQLALIGFGCLLVAFVLMRLASLRFTPERLLK